MNRKSTKKPPNPVKQEAIIKAALSVFLEYGFGHATVDEIVKRAGGSKATVYKYFEDKEKLFAKVVDDLVRNRSASELNHDIQPRDALLMYAESRLKIVYSRNHIALRRLVIGEYSRFPKIAHTYFEQGPENSRRRLEKYFMDERTQKFLKIDDPEIAAMIFQNMLMHSMYLKSLLTDHGTMTSMEIKQHANIIVDKFLKIYNS